jgi:hypothetical protein
MLQKYLAKGKTAVLSKCSRIKKYDSREKLQNCRPT